MIYLMDSFHKNQIEFEDKIFSIEELVNEFCFLRLKKKKCYLPENNKIELKKFLVEMAKTNSSYIQFKETNSKMKNKNKKFTFFYQNELKKNIRKQEESDFNNKNENEEEMISYSDEILTSVESLKRDHVTFSLFNKDNLDSEEPIKDLFLEKSVNSDSGININQSHKTNKMDKKKMELNNYIKFLHKFKSDFNQKSKSNLNLNLKSFIQITITYLLLIKPFFLY